MLYIVEGIDGAGKSFLINKLSKDCKGLFIYKNKIDTKYPWLDYRTAAYTNFMTTLEYYEQYFLKNNINVIVDRGYISEYVYGKNKRGYKLDEWVEYIENRIKDYAILVSVVCDIKTSKKRIEARGEKFSDVNKTIIEDFEYRLENCKLNYWIKFNSDEDKRQEYNKYYKLFKNMINEGTFNKISKEIVKCQKY